jgi:hypothetical protein
VGDKSTIRNLCPVLYTQARIAAIEYNCTVADVINDALEEWFGEGREYPPCEQNRDQ